jgi:hypothetical protein
MHFDTAAQHPAQLVTNVGGRALQLGLVRQIRLTEQYAELDACGLQSPDERTVLRVYRGGYGDQHQSDVAPGKPCVRGCGGNRARGGHTRGIEQAHARRGSGYERFKSADPAPVVRVPLLGGQGRQILDRELLDPAVGVMRHHARRALLNA